LVSQEVVYQMATWVPERRPSFCYLVHYPGLYRFKDVWLTPVEYDPVHSLVYMVRAIDKVTYDDMPVHPKICPVTLPIIIQVGEARTEYVLLEEACFFTAQDTQEAKPPKSKRARTAPKKKNG
jgi:hypothetical protein